MSKRCKTILITAFYLFPWEYDVKSGSTLRHIFLKVANTLLPATLENSIVQKTFVLFFG